MSEGEAAYSIALNKKDSTVFSLKAHVASSVYSEPCTPSHSMKYSQEDSGSQDSATETGSIISAPVHGKLHLPKHMHKKMRHARSYLNEFGDETESFEAKQVFLSRLALDLTNYGGDLVLTQLLLIDSSICLKV
jgi:hypothetical protein